MNPKELYKTFLGVSFFRVRRILTIAFFWTIIDIINWFLNNDVKEFNNFSVIFVRTGLIFIMSLIISYLFVFTLRTVFRNSTMLINFIAKLCILLVSALIMNFFIEIVEGKFLQGLSLRGAFENYKAETLNYNWLLKKTLYWFVLFVITQLYLEINDKYSPGVFFDIIRGKYIDPKIEHRIVMFIDLKDSTPIAERLGHEQYFLFIRDFIHDVSLALIENEGIIYQYVGDEIVVSWQMNKKNVKKSLSAVITARKNLHKHSNAYRKKFDLVPTFRAGIHVGPVTVGEIGVIKKDLAISGDTMNTTARIRDAANELNEPFIVSAEFFNQTKLQAWQAERLGFVELKGKSAAIELFSVKI